MIRCTSCGAVHRPNTLFCDECGSELSSASRVETNPLEGLPATTSVLPALKLSLSTLDKRTRLNYTLNGELLIGRTDSAASLHADVDLAPLDGFAKGVSRRHARLLRHGQQVILEDLNSLNGTFVGGNRLPPHHPQSLQPGDEVQFGRVVLRIDFSA